MCQEGTEEGRASGRGNCTDRGRDACKLTAYLQRGDCFRTVVLEKTLESPLDYEEIQPVHPKGDQSWVFIRRTDVEAETPILWPPDVKS